MNYLFTFICIFMSFILISRSGISIISSLNLIVTIIKKFSLNYDQISLYDLLQQFFQLCHQQYYNCNTIRNIIPSFKFRFNHSVRVSEKSVHSARN